MSLSIVNLIYLVASVLFILGLKGLTHPRTAVRGNIYSGLAMLIAVVVTLLDQRIISYEMILIGLAVGSLIGAILAIKIQMTGMPQLVAIYNGFGGGASVFVAGAALIEGLAMGEALSYQFTIAVAASGLIGAVTFTGSLVAWGKLQGVISEDSLRLPGQQALKVLIGLASVALAVWIVIDPTIIRNYWFLVIAGSLLGVFLTIPIGGADMPVVIALLNSYSGIAAAATGFVLENNVLIIAGSLVGASGIILTQIMCKAMNRTLTNVLFGVLQPSEDTPNQDEVYEGKIKSTSPDEVAMLFDGASRVIIVPGYGLAVAQAQHAVRDLATLLEGRGIIVEYAIHPVAGRMPGHMNVLLAEANVEYDKLKEMDEINPTFREADVAIVIGANDVVNPVAREEGTPISGMPILDVDMARFVVVIKRSLSPGFAGIPNPLFAADNTLMLFNDAKKAVTELIAAVKDS